MFQRRCNALENIPVQFAMLTIDIQARLFIEFLAGLADETVQPRPAN